MPTSRDSRGQTFASASFTLANAAQCQGGSPRFDVVTSAGTFFLGCNNVTGVTNANGTVTYTFDAASIAAGGGQVPFPTGTITAVDVLIDVQGSADLTNITFNGVVQVPVVTSGPPTTKAACKHGGWKSFTNPSFKNQGQCVAYVNHHSSHGKSHTAHKTHKLAKKGEQHASLRRTAQQRTRRSTGSRADRLWSAGSAGAPERHAGAGRTSRTWFTGSRVELGSEQPNHVRE